MNGYEQFKKIKECYNSMTDDLSKKIFIARLQYDMEPTPNNICNFLSIADKFYKIRLNMLSTITNSNKKLYLYGAGSSINDNGTQLIKIKTIDNTIKNEKVSFIKMDIEGAEFDALKGAAETIKRDKPFCAICIYHKSGDIIVIAEYLKELVPEYKFKIRHYSINMWETVLYAYVE